MLLKLKRCISNRIEQRVSVRALVTRSSYLLAALLQLTSLEVDPVLALPQAQGDSCLLPWPSPLRRHSNQFSVSTHRLAFKPIRNTSFPKHCLILERSFRLREYLCDSP